MIASLPDWGAGVTETLSWSTTVDVPRDGEAEERRVARANPTRHVQHAGAVDATIDLLLHNTYADAHVVPFLPGATRPRTLGLATTQIDLDAAPYMYGFEVDRPAVVISPDGTVQHCEVTAMLVASGLEAVFVTPAVDLVRGDVVMPAMNARLAPALEIERFGARYSRAAYDWQCTDSARWPPTALTDDEFDLASTFDTVETMTPMLGADPVEVFVRPASTQHEAVARRVEAFTAQAGATSSSAVDSVTRWTISQSHQIFTRDELWKIRRMLYRRRGRFDPCFVPAGHKLEFLGTRTAHSANWWAIPDYGWAATGGDARRAIVVHRRDGTRTYHTFSEVATNGHATIPVPAGEAWFVDLYPAPDSLDVDDVVAIDWLVYARLATDTISIRWHSCTAASVDLQWSSIQWPATW